MYEAHVQPPATSKTNARLKAAARAVASAIPRAQHRQLAGQTHNVNPGVLARGG
jgi:hypothetical protein